MPEASPNLNFSIIEVNECPLLLGRCCGWGIYTFLAVTWTTFGNSAQKTAVTLCLKAPPLATGVPLTSCRKSQECQRVRIPAVALNQWLQGLNGKLPQLSWPSLGITRKDVLCPHPEFGASGWTAFAHTITSLMSVLHWLFSSPHLIFPLPNHWFPRIRIISPMPYFFFSLRPVWTVFLHLTPNRALTDTPGCKRDTPSPSSHWNSVPLTKTPTSWS